jgi:thioesterase domain-containing protein
MPLSTLFKATTIAQLARLIEDGNTDKTRDCLVSIQPLGAKAPFYCVHGVEGDVFGYRDLANALGDDQPVIGLQAIGWDAPKTYDRTITQMAARYVQAMKSYQTTGPYRIGGYCFGGIVAYEMACQLEKMGEKVSLLAVFEGSMPVVGDRSASFFQRLGAFTRHLPSWVGDYTRMSPEQLWSRIRATFMKIRVKIRANPELERRMQAEEILNVDLNDLPDMNVELTHVNSNAFLHYEPEKYGGLLTLFRARHQSINEVMFGPLDPRMGWGDLAKGGVRVRMVDGFHRNVHLSPYVNSLASELRQCLDDTTS